MSLFSFGSLVSVVVALQRVGSDLLCHQPETLTQELLLGQALALALDQLLLS